MYLPGSAWPSIVSFISVPLQFAAVKRGPVGPGFPGDPGVVARDDQCGCPATHIW